MKSRRLISAVVGIAVASMVATACTSSDDDTGDSGGASSSAAGNQNQISYAYEQEFSAYNNDNAAANAVANAVVTNQTFGFFSHVDPKGNVARDTDYGTFEKVSDNPLTVKYTINDKAVWSDGVPVTASDWYLFWLSHKGQYSEFQPVSTTGISDINKPTDDPNGKTFTVTYSKPFGDWQTALGTQNQPLLPAHVIEKATGTNVAEAVKNDDKAAIAKIADYWNNKWVGFAPGQLPAADQIPSSGPYKLGEWKAGQSITVVPNDKWWGAKPKNGGITVKFIPQEQQVQALQNGDADVIEPQPNVDLVSSLKALGDAAKINTGPGFSYDHLDFNFRGKFANPLLRSAIAKCLPRQEIVNKLIKPVEPNADLMQTRIIYPVQDGYSTVADADGGKAYDSVDIAGAKADIAKSGVTDLTVNAIYLGNPNQRRQQTQQLIADSCGQAGFKYNVKALTPKEWGVATTSGAYDVAQFAWSGSGLVSENPPLFTSTSDQNYGKYNNPEVDKLLATLAQTSDKSQQLDLTKQIETILWKDLATIPVFAWPLLNAYSPRVSGVVLNTTQTQATFDAASWVKS
ncbi:MAG: ABC transporter family substrate-binding protein [Corynebacteriales bacterium]|uniref:ABC transporter family substrate-binding protein n=1 Tax=Williamsia sp. Leaf354 TaxID=1736349 RepID=UPI0009E98A74|nr:ABC transporter family substrate-binding protein [Williamsia sp. Leaf354]MCX6468153.1 ABC transporter family substrate-binding protein [Mycobacteriales bacterium]